MNKRIFSQNRRNLFSNTMVIMILLLFQYQSAWAYQPNVGVLPATTKSIYTEIKGDRLAVYIKDTSNNYLQYVFSEDLMIMHNDLIFLSPDGLKICIPDIPE